MIPTFQHSNAFDFLHGSWTVKHRIRRGRLDGTSDWDDYESKCVCTPILGGIGNLDQITLPHRDTVGATLRLYDPVDDCWRLHWTTSESGRLDPPLEGRFVDGVGTFHGTDVLRDDPIEVRFVWDEIWTDHARWTQSFTFAGESVWEPNWVMEFVRTPR